MGTVVRVKGLKRYQHPKTGITYCYHRKTNTRIKSEYGTAAFFVELATLEEKSRKISHEPGTLGLVISAYLRSPDWHSLRPATRVSYHRVFAVLERINNVPLIQMTRAKIVLMRDTKIFPQNGRWMANYVVTVLAILFRFAKDRGWVQENPLDDRVKRIRQTDAAAVANRPWSETECAVVLKRAPMSLRVPIALAMCTGLRKSDFLKVTMSAVRDGMIVVRTSKRGVPVRIPIHPVLAEVLASRPHSDAIQIAVNSRGAAWTETGFNASFRTFKNKLEKEGVIEGGLTPHGLRHTLGTRLREAGADDRTIADVLGQRATSMARHYSENASFPDAAKELVLGLGLLTPRS